jgi:class 3 adenylate cyclase/tetratricopeptide (TPR) repeat protein
MKSKQDVESLRPYLAAPLTRAWIKRRSSGAVWSERVTGTLMHCDVTGFTAMSERLAERGKEGAEIMAGVLNRFFQRMLGISDSWGGDQVKFGGDAMLLLFEGRNHASRAAACALEMQRAMAEFRVVNAGGEKHTLKMRIGAHCGEFYGASVGDPDNLLHYLFFGPDVNRTACIEPSASPGRVAVSDEMARELNGAFRCYRLRDGIWRLGARAARTVVAAKVHADGKSRMPAALSRYVHPIIAKRLTSESVALSGEHRRITVAFINVLGLSEIVSVAGESEALAAADGYMRLVLDALAAHGGFLLGSDAAEEGEKVIVVFGAPVSQSKPEAAALAFALDLDRGLRASRLTVRHRIGINTGFAFAGEIGSEHRREYTVLGDAINTAARLMGAAQAGGIVVSDETLGAAGKGFAVKKMRPLRLKGKARPVRASRLLSGESPPPSQSVVIEEPLVGRKDELSALLRISKRVARGKTGWVQITGEAGIGKSRLVRELEQRLGREGWRVLQGRCNAHASHVPYGIWTGVLRSVLQLGVGDEYAQLASALSSLATGHEHAVPLIADVLSLKGVRSSDVSVEDPRRTRGALNAAIVAILTAIAREKPLLLVAEDAHWMDDVSAELLSQVIRETPRRLLAVVTSRVDFTGQLYAARPILDLALAPLDREAALLVISASGELGDAQAEAVLERASGNPLLLRAFAGSQSSAAGSGLPDTIEDAIMSTIDTLPQALGEVVRAASVIGPTFETPVLSAVADTAVGSRLQSSLSELVGLGLTRSNDDEKGAYAFSHSVIRDVVYQSLPYSRRRRMHRRVIEHVETGGQAQASAACELLLYHAENAEDSRRIVKYATRSGERAASIFAGEAAVSYFQRALKELDGSGTPAPLDRCLILERLADTSETMGRHREATEFYQSALSVLAQARGSRRSRIVESRPVDRAQEAVLCRKTAVSLERAADFENSLRWLDRALEALPEGRPRLGAQIAAAKSVSLFRKGLYAEGIRWGRRALSLATRSRDSRQIAYSHNMLATSYMEQGELKRAIRHLRRSVRIYHEIGDLPGQASANNNLGMCYHLQGVLDAALYHYQVALITDEHVGDTVDSVIVRSNIGELLVTQGRLDEALEYLNRVVAAHSEGGELAGVAGLALVNIARCRAAQGNVDEARRQLRRATRLLKQVGQEGLLAEAELERTELLLLEGRTQAAMRAARLGLRHARALGAGLLEARGERLLARSQAAAGNAGKAAVHLRLSLALARRASAQHEEARSLLAMGRLLLKSGRRRAGASYLRRSERMLGRIGALGELEGAQPLLSEATA